MSTNDPSGEIRVRRARAEDLAAMLDLDRQLVRHDRRFDPTIDPRWTESAAGREFFEARLSGREGAAWVAERGGEIVAYLAGAARAAEEFRAVGRMAELECMVVRAELRGGGVGARLVETILAWCREQEVRRVSVTACAANAGAIAFYRRLGFRDYDLVLERELDG